MITEIRGWEQDGFMLLKLGGPLLEAKLAVFYRDKIASSGSWRRDTGVLRKDVEEPG
jgi:hypothetical protein